MARTRIIRVVLVFCMVLVPLLSGAAVERPLKNSIAFARSEVWKAITDGKASSATVAITVDGATIYAEGFAMADREKAIPAGRYTLFNMGSISKVYVATAIMLLVDDGKVSLDRPVTDYLPRFTMADPRYRKITVRMLLNHTSGLPGTEGANSFGFRYDNAVKEETLATMARSRLKHDPGAMAVYCNDGFTLAELVVERVSGKPYITFLRERIFKPLGLINTGMSVGDVKGKPVAFHYDENTGKPYPAESLSILGAGGLSTTAEELCRFMDVFSGKPVLLSKASVVEMRKEQPSTFKGGLRNPGASVGLGWDTTEIPRYRTAGLQVLGKSGGTSNYSSMVYTVPDKRISVAVIAASPASPATKIALDILDTVLVEKGLVQKEKKSGLVPPEAQPLPPDHTALAGYYCGNGGSLGEVTFDEENKNLIFSGLDGTKKTPVMALFYNGGYYYDDKGTRYYFTSVGNEQYMVENNPLFGLDILALQKVKTIGKPQTLETAVDGKIWLRRNVSPYEACASAESHLKKSFLYKDLPGYVFFLGLKKIDSPRFAGMPFDSIRDQTEMTLFDKDGMTWAWASDLLYSPAETAQTLKSGDNAAKIGPDGLNKWFTTSEDVVVSFTKPTAGRITIFAPDESIIYNSVINTGDVYVPKGSFIECAGLADDAFVIKAVTRTAAAR